MPKLWSSTVAEHRREVREAILNATKALTAQHGLRGVTMSRIADEVGIGRATLYKYFPDVEAILSAWHEQQVNTHLVELDEIKTRVEDPARRVNAVLQAYAARAYLARGRHPDELARLLHGSTDQLQPAVAQVRELLADILADAARVGVIRRDVPAAELADYCLNALGAAAGMDTDAAVSRLVTVVVHGLRPA